MSVEKGTVRDLEPISIDEFSGLWKRGDADACPPDHFTDGQNVQFIESGFETREGLDTLIAKGNVLRMFNYSTANGESLIILVEGGAFYHALLDGSNTVYGPILTIAECTDFDIYVTAGRVYITPFKTFTDGNGDQYQKGLQNQFVYVYKGDGTNARKAAGNPPTNSSLKPFVAYNSQYAGGIEEGIHVFAVAYKSGADLSSALGPEVFPVIIAPGGYKAYLNNIPTDGVSERVIFATRSIKPNDYDPSNLPPFYELQTITDPTIVNIQVDFVDASITVPFAAGTQPVPTDGGALKVENTTNDGFCDTGLHIIGVVYETDTGYLTAPGPEFFAVQSFVDIKKAVNIRNIPVSPDSFVTKRHLVATKAIGDYNGDQTGFQFFFIPEGTISDNVTTTKQVSFYDIDLLEDASHLIDNFAEIPAGVNLASYNGRMTLCATFDDPSVIYVSAQGEPEAIDQVDGVIIIPIDGNPVTCAQEFRNVLYVFKKTRTWNLNDNGDEPSTWVPLPTDLGIGAPVHGIGQVLDSGGVNIEFLVILDLSGIMIFNGLYARPELSWKIQDLWLALDKNDFASMQVVNDTILQRLYISLTNRTILLGDYADGFNYKDIKWMPWTFDIETTTIALIQNNVLAIGALQAS